MMDMRKHLRKPAPIEREDSINWKALFALAMERTKDVDPTTDPRVRYLRAADPDNPENTLRRLSIISVVDLDREFKSE